MDPWTMALLLAASLWIRAIPSLSIPAVYSRNTSSSLGFGPLEQVVDTSIFIALTCPTEPYDPDSCDANAPADSSCRSSVEVRPRSPERPDKPSHPEEAPKRATEPEAGKWAGPEHYKGDASIFMRGEVGKAILAGRYPRLYNPNWSDYKAIPTSSYVVRFENQPTDLAVRGLYGCTSLVIVSRRGAWAVHWWEVPTMKGALLSKDPLVFEPEEAKWLRQDRDIDECLGFGDGWCKAHKAGIHNLRNAAIFDENMEQYTHIFDNEAEPVAFIVTPLPYTENSGHGVEYYREVSRITVHVAALFDGYEIPTRVIAYKKMNRGDMGPPDTDLTDIDYVTSNGKILVQYQPASDSDTTTKWRIWVEGHLREDAHMEWNEPKRGDPVPEPIC